MIRRAFPILAVLMWAGVALAQDTVQDGGPDGGQDVVQTPADTVVDQLIPQDEPEQDDSAGETPTPPGGATSDVAVDPEPLDPEWENLSARAINAVEAGAASTAAFEDLRTQLADWREVFLSRQNANSGRIATLEAQIEALGEPSEDEPQDITALRDELAETRARLRVPAARAAEAHAEADGLIAEIDAIIRERQAETLLSRGPSPLTPRTWVPAFDALGAALRSTSGEIVGALNTPSRRSAIWAELPVTGVLAVISLVLLARGRRWVGWLEGRVRARTHRGRGVWTFVISLGKVLLPFAGLFALSAALTSTGIPGRRLGALITALPFLGLYPIVAHWLAGHLLPVEDDGLPGPLNLTVEARRRLRARFIGLGYAITFAGLAFTWIDISGIEGTSAAVLRFPFGAAVAVAVFLIGRALLAGRSDDSGEESADVVRPFRDRVLALLGRLLVIDAVVGLALSVLGFTAAFTMVVFPSAGTLYLLATLVLLQRLVFDIFALLTGAEGEGTDGLVPVTIAFLLTLTAMPLLALLWGARVTDLTEIWARFREGFDIGGTVISPSNFLIFIVVFVVGYTAVRLLQAGLKSTVLPRTKMDIGGQNAVSAGVGYVGIFLAAVIAITMAGIDLSGLAIVAGALSVGIGFGLQNIVSNFISGIILLVERPISQGDWIEVGGQMGYVRDISVRSTRIETFDRTDVIVPNADLISGTVTNYTRGNSVGRLTVPVGVAYGTDTRRVQDVLQEIAEAHPMVLLNPKPAVDFMGFGADSLDFRIRAILRDVNWILSVRTEMNHEIARRFAEEGFEIPFAQRDIWLRNPETLHAAGKDDNADPEGGMKLPETDTDMRPTEGDMDAD